MDAPIDLNFPARLARRLAARLETDPDTLASVFARYRAAEGIDDAGLAAYFAVDPDVLPHIALCGRPRDALFLTDVTAVAERFSFDPSLLAVLVRHVDALHEFGRGVSSGHGRFLAAARDRAAEDTPSYNAAPDASNLDDSDQPEDESLKRGGKR